MKKLAFLFVVFFSLFGHSKQKKTLYIYSAGPEVFLPPEIVYEINDRKSRFINHINETLLKDQDFKFKGLLLVEGSETENYTNTIKTGLKIFQKDIELMNKADIIIANVVRFRGAHADPGTSFEIGYMHSQGKPVVLFYDETFFYNKKNSKHRNISPKDDFRTRASVLNKARFNKKAGSWIDEFGFFVEDFQMLDNLMLVSPHVNIMAKYKLPTEILSSFEQAVTQSAQLMIAMRKPSSQRSAQKNGKCNRAFK